MLEFWKRLKLLKLALNIVWKTASFNKFRVAIAREYQRTIFRTLVTSNTWPEVPQPYPRPVSSQSSSFYGVVTVAASMSYPCASSRFHYPSYPKLLFFHAGKQKSWKAFLWVQHKRANLTINDPALFAIFRKIGFKKSKSSMSPQLRVPEERIIARLKGLVLGFHLDQVSPCRHASPPSEF